MISERIWCGGTILSVFNSSITLFLGNTVNYEGGTVSNSVNIISISFISFTSGDSAIVEHIARCPLCAIVHAIFLCPFEKFYSLG